MLQSPLEGRILRAGVRGSFRVHPGASSSELDNPRSSRLAELPAGTVRKEPRQTVQRISTSVRRGEAPVYRDLAAAAHAAGFPKITPGQVHEWVMDGLLPAIADQHSLGRHGFETVRRPGVADQLIALCRLRARTKSWDRLAVLLWLDRWPITADRLRRAVLADLLDPATLRLNPGTDAGLDRLDEYSRKLGPRFARRSGLGRVGSRAAASGYLAGLAAFLGGPPLDEEGAQAVEKLAGLSRARKDTFEGAAPWLDGPAHPGVELPDAAELRELAGEASEAELEAARPRARFLAIDLPLIARALELGLGNNAAGLGFLARGHVTPEIGLALALHFGSTGMGPQIDSLAGSLSDLAYQMSQQMPVVEAYVADHPGQRRAIRKFGLKGLDDRGELVLPEPSGAGSGNATPPTGPE